MTEIPEHLLKRSRERRSSIGQGDDTAEASGAPATTPATTAPAAASPAAASAGGGPPARTVASPPSPAEAPKPDPVHVAAAKQRRKIPFWAMATLSLMPVWGFMYVRSITESTEVAHGPIGDGAEVYNSCASCHGASGDGGVGYAFSGGSVLDTFPNIEDQIRFVYYGTEGYNSEGVDIYGSPDRPGGVHITGDQGVMPAFGTQLHEEEIVAVVCHERYTLAGADPTSDEWAEEFEAWCSAESPIYEGLGTGELQLTTSEQEMLGEVPFNPIGQAPIPGSSG